MSGFSTPIGASASYTPTVTSSTGTITTASATANFRRFLPGLAFIDMIITVTTNGTGATSVRGTLPSGVTGVTGVTQMIIGYNATGQQSLVGRIVGAGTQIIITTDDGGYPAVDGEIIYVSGVVRVA